MNILNKTKDQLVKAKNIVFIICCLSIAIGILAMFVASLFNNSIAISDMNNFIGISLGIVATTTSLLSMFLSFYNLEKSEISEAEQRDALVKMMSIQHDMKNTLQKIDVKTGDIHDYYMKKKPRNETINKEESDWTSFITVK